MLFKPEVETSATTVYNPPVPDFAVCKISLDGTSEENLPVRSSASILLFVSGAGRYRAGRPGSTEAQSGDFKKGTMIFLAAGEQIFLKGGGSTTLAFQAFC